MAVEEFSVDGLDQLAQLNYGETLYSFQKQRLHAQSLYVPSLCMRACVIRSINLEELGTSVSTKKKP